jgi:L-lactate dehydrogenase complex protein LldG
MSDATIEQFADSLSETSVSLSRARAAEVRERLDDLIDGPAVGAPLPFQGARLPSDVDTAPAPATLDEATWGVTPATLGIADYGSVVVGETGDGTEPASLFVDTHVAVVAASDVVPSMAAAIDQLGTTVREGLTSAVVATGPSATADMGSLVLGAHGPKSVHVVLLIDR